MDKYTGKKLDSRYEIHELIGMGGMAYVYRCYDSVDDREVAIKILKDEFLDNEDFLRRFKNESKSIALLSHPNIVKVYDVSFGDMIQYIVMEYIDGITLKEYIAQQGIISWKETLHLTTQILRALQHAHSKGIVHRDIKPQNIMLLQDGTIKVTDFGIARNENNNTRTMTEQAIGSVHYIAPEQARGSVTDSRTDIYSVGVMMYEMLTGKLPFEADNAVSVAVMQLQQAPKMPRIINPDIPEGLEEITIKAMQKNPEERYHSAMEMLDDFDRFRLNPSIRFNYKYFTSDAPTKYVDAGKRRKGVQYDDSYDEVLDENEKPKKNTNTSAIVKGAIIALVVAIVVFSILAISKSTGGSSLKDVDVPNYIGNNVVDVQNKDENNFKFEIKQEYDESKEIGEVLEQNPEAGSKKVKEGSVIELTVNGTDTEITIPALNSTEDIAVKALEDRNLVANVIYVSDKNTIEDYVSAVYPGQGSKVSIGSTVYVYVAKPEPAEPTEIPKLRGMSLSEASAALEELGLKVKYEYDNDSYEKKDTVLVQSPLEGGKVKAGATVNLVLSGGKTDETTVPVEVDLPKSETATVLLRVIVDGVVTQSKNVVPSYNSTYKFELTGTDTSTVVIELNGAKYRQYSVDFVNKKVTCTGRYTYNIATISTSEPETSSPTPSTSTPSTEPSTAAPSTADTSTVPTEETTENYE